MLRSIIPCVFAHADRRRHFSVEKVYEAQWISVKKPSLYCNMAGCNPWACDRWADRIALANKCDAIVATVTAEPQAQSVAETEALDFLSSAAVQHWVEAQGGSQ